ncbi:SURF1 family protein [Cupriavidus basilensis]|uniref:SURF1 family protein n=1 Tax=Cupriavidus basilensis TaxID=68895 RepID=UPI00157AC842|nr:SURF1 family protein [Cupriavidus basilensis]NUA26499.1 SURF1 family protein [Cupriavidus basilensis]
MTARQQGVAQSNPPSRKRATGALVVFALLAIVAVAGLLSLGVWQVERRAWKLDLIERVNARVHAPATAAPGADQWPRLTKAADEYRRVRLTGTFLNDSETLVQAVTELGGGFWVMTPLRTVDGNVVLVNRGFVPPELSERAKRGGGDPTGETTVTGLLRFSEPGNGFLRTNDPAAGRWYARDVPAIAAARGLRNVAPYFIDADAAVPLGDASKRTWPVGGLTVITFNNNHLVYAITWFALALMFAAGAVYAGREAYRRSRAGDTRDTQDTPGEGKAGRRVP